MNMQALISVVYPARCITCDEFVASDFGLCPRCWRDTPFITGLTCDKCGAPIPGDADDAGPHALCDTCLAEPRPWRAGRAAMIYADNGRRIVLAFKHGDRMDLARVAAGWLARAAEPLLRPDMIVVPIPLHFRRLFRRRYNQSALLAARLARRCGLDHCPDALVRTRHTASQGHKSGDERFRNVADALAPHRRRGARLRGRPVLVVDDVMTSGATFTAATRACLEAGASDVFVLSLARVVKPA